MRAEFWIFIAVLIITFIIRMPLLYGMLSACVIYFLATGGEMGYIANLITHTLYSNYVIIAIPLFLFTAEVMNSGEVTDTIFKFCKDLVGKVRGSLAYVNVLASLVFSGMTGSALADAAGLGKMEIEAMRREGYDDGFSCAITAASATIGPIFPPSIPFVVYSMLSGVSVGALFLSGIGPGVLLAVALAIYIAFAAKRKNLPQGERVPLRALLRQFVRSFLALMTPVILLIGIYTGVMTPTEAGAVAGLYALILSVLVYRVMNLKTLIKILEKTAIGTGTVSMMVGVSAAMNYIVTRNNIGTAIVNFFTEYVHSSTVFMLIVIVMFVIIGMFLDNSVAMMVFVPLLIPVAQSYNINLVHFGVIVCLNMMIGLSSPPYGMCLFVTSAISKCPLKKIIVNVMPMLLVMFIVLLLCAFIPDLVLFIPKMAGFKV